jgi:hypothetical protein
MPDEQQQLDCENKFEAMVMESGMRQADANDLRMDGHDGDRQLAATNSTIRAHVYAMEYAALEAHKRDPQTRKALTPEAENAFRELGFKLDEFIVPGEENLEQRRLALLKALDNPAPGHPGNINFQTAADYAGMAAELNRDLPPALHRAPWQAHELAEAVGSVHSAIGLEGESANPVFRSQQTREYIETMGDRQDREEEIERLNLTIGNMQQSAIHQHVPAIQAARSQTREADEIAAQRFTDVGELSSDEAIRALSQVSPSRDSNHVWLSGKGTAAAGSCSCAAAQMPGYFNQPLSYSPSDGR